MLTARLSSPAAVALGGGAAATLGLAALSALAPPAAAGVVVGLPLLLLLGWALVCPLGQALILAVAAHVFADTLKRVVIVAGGEGMTQYVPLAAGVALVLVVGARGWIACHRRGWRAADTCFTLLLGCLALAVLWSRHFGWTAKAMALPFALLPYALYFAARSLPPGEERQRVLDTWVVLGVVVALYGLFQALAGPSWLDRAWARASAAFSIEASHVWRSVTSGKPLRPYSFLADHFSYAYFLVSALLALGTGGGPRRAGGRAVVFLVLLVALALALTRAAWAAVVLGAGAAWLWRRTRPAVFLAVTLGSYLALSAVVVELYERYFPRQSFRSELTARAFSLGTLAARRHAGEAMLLALRRFPLLGDAGEASGAYFVTAKLGQGLEGALASRRFDDAHNYLVALVSTAGLPGLAAFLAWFALTLRRAGRRRAQAWAVGGATGLFLAGVAGSATVLAGFPVVWLALAAEEG